MILTERVKFSTGGQLQQNIHKTSHCFCRDTLSVNNIFSQREGVSAEAWRGFVNKKIFNGTLELLLTLSVNIIFSQRDISVNIIFTQRDISVNIIFSQREYLCQYTLR